MLNMLEFYIFPTLANIIFKLQVRILRGLYADEELNANLYKLVDVDKQTFLGSFKKYVTRLGGGG